jgi:hypothetical protein
MNGLRPLCRLWRASEGSDGLRGAQPSKKPGVSAGLLISIRRTLSDGFIRHDSGAASPRHRHRLSGAAARAPDALRSRTSRNPFCPRGSPGWGRQPEVKWPAAPSLPTTSNCPASIERWPAPIQTGKPCQVPSEKPESALRQACSTNADGWNGLQAQTSPLQERDCGMENFLLFVLSSSFCTLVASVTLLLWPLLAVH